MRIGSLLVNVSNATELSVRPYFAPVTDTITCMACFGKLGDRPVPVPQSWQTKTSPHVSAQLAGWTCCEACLHELMRFGFEACPDTLNMTRLCLLHHSAKLELDAATFVSRSAEQLAAAGWCPQPPVQTIKPAQRPAVRVGHMLVSPDLSVNGFCPVPGVRCLNCLRADMPSRSIPIVTQLVVCGYTSTAPEEDVQAHAAKCNASVERDADGVYTFKGQRLTDTEEEFWLAAPFDSEPVVCFHVYGYVCGAGCMLNAVGEPAGCGWKVSEPGDFYAAVNVLYNLMYGVGVSSTPPDLYTGEIRRSRWAVTAPAFDPDPFVHIKEFDIADVEEQERRALVVRCDGVCPLDEAIKQMPSEFTSIKRRLQAARRKKIPM